MICLAVLIIVAVVGAVIYGRDPWLWRRFFGLFRNFNDPTYMDLRPVERVEVGDVYEVKTAVSAQHTISDQAIQDATQFAEAMDSFGLVVIHKGQIQCEWYGQGWDRNRKTQSQSMHKSVLPVLLHNAILDGAITSFDDPVGKYIHEWAHDPRGNITLHQMLIMSSGLAQYGFTLNPFSKDFRWLYSGNTLPIVLSTELIWQPGTKFDYNNINSYLLGIILETV